MEEISLEKKKPSEVCIYPLKKTRRVLLFLADFFVSFFLAFALFHLAANPIAGVIMDNLGLSEEMETSQRNRDEVLYGFDLLFAEESQEPSYLSTNIEYTAERYIGHFVGVTDLEDAKYNVFQTYWVSIRNEKEAYLSMFSTYDEEGAYFDVSNDAITLKDPYKTEWAPYFDPKDTISTKGSDDMSSFIESFFLPAYSGMLSDILERDLVYDGISYKASQTRFSEISDMEDLSIVFAALSAHLVSSLFYFLAIPFISKNRKTVGMMALRIERVDASRLILLRRRRILARFVFDFVSGAMGLFLLPLTAVDFNELFSLPLLFPMSLVATVYVLASTVFLLVDGYGRPLSDRLTGTVMVDGETLDEIYRAKGYPI